MASNPISWIGETFSAGASEDDIVKSRSLNITRIAGVVFPVLAGIAAAIGDLADKKPFNDEGFQKTLILVGIAFIAVVAVGDMFARAITTAAELHARDSQVIKLGWMPATHIKDDGSQEEGHVDEALAAARADGKAQLRFVPVDPKIPPDWYPSDKVVTRV